MRRTLRKASRNSSSKVPVSMSPQRVRRMKVKSQRVMECSDISSPCYILSSRRHEASKESHQESGTRYVQPPERWYKYPAIADFGVYQVDAFGYLQMCLLWVSANLTANNLAVGLLGPSVYSLSFLDSALCITFGCLIGCLCTGYMATFGPQSGNRTMVSRCSTSKSVRPPLTCSDHSSIYHGLVAQPDLRCT